MKLSVAQIAGFLEKPPASVRAILVYGPDSGLVHERAEALAGKLVDDKNDPFAVVSFSGASLGDDVGRLHDEVASVPFGGGRRLVRIHQATEALTAPLSAFAKAPPPGDGVILIEAGDLEKRSKLRTLCEGESSLLAAIPCYVEDATQRARTIAALLDADKIRASRDVIRLLNEILPPDRMAMRSELDKLALYAREKGTVSEEDVVAIITDAGGADIDDLVQAAASGDVARTTALFDRLMAEQTAPVTLLRAMQRHLLRLQLARSYMKDGISADQAIKRLSPPVFWKQVELMKKQLQRWSPERLEMRLVQLLEAETAVKRTGVPDSALTAQLFLSLAAKT